MNHVAEFMRLHGGILQFSQQGLEKYNDVMTKQYFRGTNHKGETAPDYGENEPLGPFEGYRRTNSESIQYSRF